MESILRGPVDRSLHVRSDGVVENLMGRSTKVHGGLQRRRRRSVIHQRQTSRTAAWHGEPQCRQRFAVRPNSDEEGVFDDLINESEPEAEVARSSGRKEGKEMQSTCGPMRR